MVVKNRLAIQPCWLSNHEGSGVFFGHLSLGSGKVQARKDSRPRRVGRPQRDARRGLAGDRLRTRTGSTFRTTPTMIPITLTSLE